MMRPTIAFIVSCVLALVADTALAAKASGGPAFSLSGGTSLPATCGTLQVFIDYENPGQGLYLCLNGSWVPVSTSTVVGLQEAFDNNNTISGSTSEDNCFQVGDNPNFFCILFDPTEGFLIKTIPSSHTRQRIDVGKTGGWSDVEGQCDGERITPAAGSPNAVYQYDCAHTKVKASAFVALSARGSATMTESQPVAGMPKTWWGTLTDSDSDAFDFSFPITKRMEGATTATVRLIGLSDNASPSGNVELDCAMKAYRPGTDTFGAHDTTGEQAVVLTPATQNRSVGATSSSITINGTIADGGIMLGACEVDATNTTSAQLTDFFLYGFATIQFLTNSRSD
jgi:hypothetical protein